MAEIAVDRRSQALAALAAELRVFRLEVAAVAALHAHDGAADPGSAESRVSEAGPERCRSGLNRGGRFRRDVAGHGPHEAESQREAPGADHDDAQRANHERQEERAEHRAAAPERILHEAVERQEDRDEGQEKEKKSDDE